MASFADQLLQQTPTLGFRFGVFFFAGGIIPNPVDFRFKRVSGISTSISTSSVEEGGQNLFSHRLPDRVQYDNLVLERGKPVVSPLAIEFNVTMSQFKFAPANVLVSLLNEAGVPISSWLFIKAYPVSWNISDLDAEANSIVVETMELAYERFQSISL
ncbi:MAG: phage tail protein [Gammaproteobacteria bacterium]|nr:MAG: phage tail protein [Gammaproteobacteria bacterium]